MASKRKAKSLLKKRTKLYEQIKHIDQEINEECKAILASSKKVVVIEKETPVKEGGKVVGMKVDKVYFLKWTETFVDEDTGKPFKFKRQQCVKINDTWKLAYFTPEEIIKLA